MNNNIKIICWTGKILYQGPCDDEQVDVVLNANRCKHCDGGLVLSRDTFSTCKECNESGYSGDFHVEWEDSSIDENVYEAINY